MSLWILWVRQGARVTGKSYMPSLHRHELETWTKGWGARRHYKPEWKADRLEAEQSFGAGREQHFLYWNYPYLHTCMHIKDAVPAPSTWTPLLTPASSLLQPEPHQPWLTFFHLGIGVWQCNIFYSQYDPRTCFAVALNPKLYMSVKHDFKVKEKNGYQEKITGKIERRKHFFRQMVSRRQCLKSAESSVTAMLELTLTSWNTYQLALTHSKTN